MQVPGCISIHQTPSELSLLSRKRICSQGTFYASTPSELKRCLHKKAMNLVPKWTKFFPVRADSFVAQILFRSSTQKGKYLVSRKSKFFAFFEDPFSVQKGHVYRNSIWSKFFSLRGDPFSEGDNIDKDRVISFENVYVPLKFKGCFFAYL